MNTYLTLFIIATAFSLLLTPIVRRVCERFGLVDEPRDERRVHTKAVPRLGGIAVFASMLIALAALPLVDNLVTRTLLTNKQLLLIMLVPAALVFLFGIYDDVRGADARLKFVAQGLAGTLFFILGGRITALSVPFVGSIELPLILSFVVTIFWIIAITNAFNLIDGMDGLASGAALFASFALLVVSLVNGHQFETIVAIALSGALIGFLRYNFNPALIFLGDSGALFIGFTLAAISVEGAQKASTAVAVTIPLLAFGLPVVDTGFSIARRFVSGKPLFGGDREHIHHMLLARGWSQRRVVLVLYGVCATFGLLALVFVTDAARRATGFVLLVVGAAVVLGVGRLRYHEVDEFKAGVKRNLTKRRLRVANNIRVRRASRTMSHASTLGQIFDALQEMLDVGEFVYATVQLDFGGSGETAKYALAREAGTVSLRRAELLNNTLSWTWERGDIEAEEIIGSGKFWSLRLPLSTNREGCGYLNFYREFDSDPLLVDITYLCNLFHRETARAIERVMLANEQKSGEHALSMSVTSGD